MKSVWYLLYSYSFIFISLFFLVLALNDFVFLPLLYVGLILSVVLGLVVVIKYKQSKLVTILGILGLVLAFLSIFVWLILLAPGHEPERSRICNEILPSSYDPECAVVCPNGKIRFPAAECDERLICCIILNASGTNT